MNKRSIAFWAPALAALLALSLGTSARGQGVKYLPNDTEVIINVNLKQVWNSKLVKDYNALIKQIQGLFNAKIEGNNIAADFKKSLGIDPFKDVDVITVGMTEFSKDTKNLVFVLEGNFNPEKFTATFNAKAKDEPEVYKSMTIGNATVFQLTKAGEEPFFLGLLDKSILVMSKTKEGMTTAANGPVQNLKKETADLLQGANMKKSLTVVMTANAIEDAVKKGNNAQAQFITPYLKNLNGLTINANVVTDIDFNVNYVAKDAAAAQDMLKAVNQGLDASKVMVNNMAKKDANVALLADIMKTLKVSAQGNTMMINGAVPHDVVDGVMKKIENFLP